MLNIPVETLDERSGWIFQNRAARKILTRALWYWQKVRPRPARQKAFRLPALSVATQSNATLVILAATDMVSDAAWAAMSYLRTINADLELCLIVDSTSKQRLETHEKAWLKLFPGSRIISSFELVEAVADRAPALTALALRHPLIRKLVALLHFQEKKDIIYSDSDVLCLNKSPEIENFLASQGSPRYIQDVGVLNGEPRLLAHAKQLGWPPPAHNLNSGLLLIRRGSFSVKETEELFAAGEYDQQSWFIEQSAVALLMSKAGGQPLPKDRYVVSTRGQFYFQQDEDYEKITLRHFVTPVRHLMHLKAMPRLWEQWHKTL